MTTPETSTNNGTAADHQSRMIRKLIPWPPSVTWAFGRSPAVERGDMVVAAELMTPAYGVISLRLSKRDGHEYGVELSLPVAAVDGVLQAIAPGMTLAAIGELEIVPAPLSEKAIAPAPV